MSVCGHDPYCPGHGPEHDAAVEHYSSAPTPLTLPQQPVGLEERVRSEIAEINEAIGSLSELRPEARELARSGHPANKSEGKKAVAQIQSEIRRLSAERRRLKELLPDAVE